MLRIGDSIIFSSSTISAVVAGTIYFVLTIPTSTTFTISASYGGTALLFATSGSGTFYIGNDYSNLLLALNNGGF